MGQREGGPLSQHGLRQFPKILKFCPSFIVAPSFVCLDNADILLLYMQGVKILDSLPMTNNVLQTYQVCDKCAGWDLSVLITN